MRHFFAALLLICFQTYLFFAAPNFNPKDLSVVWEPIKNDAPKQGQSLNAITITNNGKTTLPTSGWKLYFNCARWCCLPALPGMLKLSFINGDLFSMTANAGITWVKTGLRFRIEFVDDDA